MDVLRSLLAATLATIVATVGWTADTVQGPVSNRSEAIVLAGEKNSARSAHAAREVETPEHARSAELFRSMRYGIFTHVVYQLTVCSSSRKNYRTLDEFANMFDVQEYVRQVEAMGVEYVIFTVWHAGMYNLGPNAALDKWLPGHTAKRDLIGELADVLDERGIKMIFYLNPYDGHDLTPEESARVGWIKYSKENPQPIPVFNDFISDVFAETAKRYAAKRNIIGVWWDSWQGGAANDHRTDGMRLRRSIHAAMPQALTLSNFSDHPDYRIIDFHSSEVYVKRNLEFELDSLRIRFNHQSCEIGQNWMCEEVNRGIVYGPQTLFQWTVMSACAGAPGGIAWAISPSADCKTWGGPWPWKTHNLEVLCKLGAYIKPIRESLCGVATSQNWPVKEVYFSKTPGYGATRSLDGSKEYLHVLKVPLGRTLEVKPPKETFVSARLLVGGHPVTMQTTSRGLSLTLVEGDQWDPLDTVIVLERAR